MSRPPNPVLGAFAALGAFALYSGYDMGIKALGGQLSTLQILFCAGIAGFPLLAIRLLMDREPLPLRPVLPRWMAFRVIVIILNGILGGYAFALLPLAQAYSIFFLMPLAITVLAVPVLGERIDVPRGLAVLLGLVGVVIAVRPGSEPLNLGHAAAFAAVTLGAFNYVSLRRTGGVENWAVLMVWPMVAMQTVLTIAMPFVWQPLTGAQALLTGAMAVMGFVGALFIIAAYRLAPAIVVAPMQYSQILWASIMGWLVFDEVVHLQTWIGIAVIVTAGMVILWRSDK